jgi:hypothetical protein
VVEKLGHVTEFFVRVNPIDDPIRACFRGRQQKVLAEIDDRNERENEVEQDSRSRVA